MAATKLLTIGQLAKMAGVGVETIRYYQRRGLMPVPDRCYGSIRRYPETMVARLMFIRRAKQLGFSLAEVSELLAIGDGGCADVAGLAAQKKAQIEKKISDLKKIEAQLDALLDQCRAGKSSASCPIINSLMKTEEE